MPRLRVHNFAISFDGLGAGPSQDMNNWKVYQMDANHIPERFERLESVKPR